MMAYPRLVPEHEPVILRYERGIPLVREGPRRGNDRPAVAPCRRRRRDRGPAPRHRHSGGPTRPADPSAALTL